MCGCLCSVFVKASVCVSVSVCVMSECGMCVVCLLKHLCVVFVKACACSVVC